MGNIWSDTRNRDYRNFTIVGKKIRSGQSLNGRVENSTKFNLADNLVNYQDGDFRYINFVNHRSLEIYNVGDSIKIDMVSTRQQNSTHIFEDRSVIKRGEINTRNLTEGEEWAGKITTGTFVMSLNYFCPEVGDVVADGLKITGHVTEAGGYLTDNKKVEKFGEILQGGAGIGASGSSLHNLAKGKQKLGEHSKKCVFNCKNNFLSDEKTNKTIDGLSAAVEITKTFFK